MDELDLRDLRRVDRDVARTVLGAAKWRAGLARDPVTNAGGNPFQAARHVAGQSTYEALAEVVLVSQEEPLRQALRRWVHALIRARVVGDLDADWESARFEPRGRFQGRPPRKVSYRDAWRGLLASPSVAEAELYLAAATDAAEPLAPIARERAARLVEVERRLESHYADLAPAPLAALRAAASELLSATADIAAAARKDALRGERVTTPSAVPSIIAALGRDANEGWPAHLIPRWLDELFGAGVRGLSIELAPLPPALGAASFARALGEFGYAFRRAASARSLPFALARDPEFVSAHRFGYVFAQLPTSEAFHRGLLGVARRPALDQARVLARSALFEARLQAVRFLLATEETFAPRDRFEEWTAQLFGAPLPPALAGAWPAPRDDEAARTAALLTTLPLARELVDRFDVDWFKNPRAFPHLRAIGSGPAREEIEEGLLLSSARDLARALEAVVG